MRTNIFTRCTYLWIATCLCLIHLSCDEDDHSAKLGAPARASFTVTEVAGKTNTYLLESTSENAYRYQWDLGLGEGLRAGGPSIEAHYLAKGTYQAKLYAYGMGGYDIATEIITVEYDDFTPILEDPTFQLLAGKTWKLDANAAAPITVGTENNPAEYFGGGSLVDYQIDDEYNFAYVDNRLMISYNANGSTFNAGNVTPNYVCGTDRSYQSTFNFSTTVQGEGIATITIPGSPPDRFIGVTDVSSNNYRIISITETALVLRSGTTAETVHQMRFVAE